MELFEIRDSTTEAVTRFWGWLAAENTSWNLSGRTSRCVVFRQADGGIVVGLDTFCPEGGFDPVRFGRVFRGNDWDGVKAAVLSHDFEDASKGAFWMAWNRAYAQHIEEYVARRIKMWKRLILAW